MMASDPWDQPQLSTTGLQIPSTRRPAATAAPVPDDWENDDDDDDDEPDNEQHNQRIWDDANAKVPAPMPSLILSPSSSSSRTIISPPPGAFQAPMRILKRPSSTASPNPIISTGNSSSTEALKDREARYIKARERIFGEDAESREHSASFPSSSSSSLSTSLVPPSATSSSEQLENDASTTQSRTPSTTDLKAPSIVSVVRNPRGPREWSDENEHASTDGNTSLRGFEGRRTKPPSQPEEQAAEEDA